MSEQKRFSYTLARTQGQADIDLFCGADPAQAQGYVRIPQIRGFELLAVGRPAEELPRLVSRISSFCPWHHHLAATMAVENALHLTVPVAARNIRELVLLLGHIRDKLFHFFVLSAPDIDPAVPDTESLWRWLGESAFPPAVMEVRQKVAHLLHALAGQSWGGECAVIGGQSCGLDVHDLEPLLEDMAAIRVFCREHMEIAYDSMLQPLFKKFSPLDEVPFASLGCVDKEGNLCLSSAPGSVSGSVLRLVQPNGESTDFAPRDYQQHIVEEFADWTRAPFYRLRNAPPLTLDPDHCQGVFRVGPLARLHACDKISTPLAQKELERFRSERGALPQNALLYHWARLIELLHCVEKAEQLLRQLNIQDDYIRATSIPKKSDGPLEGFAHLEAPRGSLFYKLSLDENLCISACHIVSPTACNNAAMNITLTQALRHCLSQGPRGAVLPASSACSLPLDDNQVQMLSTCVRAYAPCPACAAHALSASAHSVRVIPAPHPKSPERGV